MAFGDSSATYTSHLYDISPILFAFQAFYIFLSGHYISGTVCCRESDELTLFPYCETGLFH